MWAIQSEVGSVRYFWVPNMGNAYVIGDDGTLWSRHQRVGWKSWILSDDWTQRNLSPDSFGYLVVSLSFNGIQYTRGIHQLVCEAVWGPCPLGQEACHNDGNPANNHWLNLRYGTREDQHADRRIHGTDNRGERHPNAQLNWTKVREIRAKYATGKYFQKDLALEYGVSRGSIGLIVTFRTWIEDQRLVI
jgi:hypothetical protein